MGRVTTSTAAILAGGAIALAGCAKKNESAADASAAATAVADGSDVSATASSTAAAAAAPSGLTDANIVAILDAANVSDSSWGAIAAMKGTGADVRNFGKTMMRDHHALRQAGLDLAKKLGVAPQLPVGDDSQSELQAHAGLLNNTAKGKDFDRAYIDHEVEYHKQVLAMATKAMAAAQSTELKHLIQKAAPNILGHLDAAEAIQKKMK